MGFFVDRINVKSRRIICSGTLVTSAILTACVPESLVQSLQTSQDSIPVLQKSFFASKYVLTKVTQRDADDKLMILETSQFNPETNEIKYFEENRLTASIRRSLVKYSPDGLLLFHRISDENGVLQQTESIEHDNRRRFENSLINTTDDDTPPVQVQSFEYNDDRLSSRTISSSPDQQLIESDSYSYSSSGQIDVRLSQRRVEGAILNFWTKFEYDSKGRISKRINGDGDVPGAGITGYELLNYDANNNLSIVVDKDNNEKTLAITRFEYRLADEPVYNRTQRALVFNP